MAQINYKDRLKHKPILWSIKIDYEKIKVLTKLDKCEKKIINYEQRQVIIN